MPRTILLADDSATIRKVVELTFSDSDIRVECVASGTEALERVRIVRPDLVLADVVMPGPSGYEVCRAVKSSDHPVPVLLLAGTFEPFDAGLAEDCGADGHMVKPFESQALLDRVADLLDRAAVAVDVEAPVEAEVEEEVATEVEVEVAAPEPEPAAPVDELPDDDDEVVEIPVHHADAPEPAAAAPAPAGSLSPEQIDAIAEAVLERLSDRVVREIAWEVVPELAEVLVRERLRQLEDEASS
jgi:CheY-like chemotaxis protein